MAYPVGAQTGERNNQARLTQREVEAIKDHVRFGWRTYQVAEWFGVHHDHVSNIMAGRRWRHVQ